jgi:hypothetical protein
MDLSIPAIARPMAIVIKPLSGFQVCSVKIKGRYAAFGLNYAEKVMQHLPKGRKACEGQTLQLTLIICQRRRKKVYNINNRCPSCKEMLE